MAMLKPAEHTYPTYYLYQRIVKAKLYIDEYYCEKIDLDNISDEASFSKFHFIRLFKSVYGKTPHQYLTYVRIENAKRLLQQNESVNDTCFKTGFDSVTSFTGLFKRTEGTSPSLYKELFFKRQQRIKDQPLNFVPNCFAENNGWVPKSNFQEVS